jgi:hypothetical protein
LAFAEESVALRQLEEIGMLREILHTDSGIHRNRGREARQALIIANAVRATLAAESQSAFEQVSKAEAFLQVSRDASEAAEDRLRVADQQLGNLLETMDAEGIASFSSLYSEQDILRPIHRSQYPYPCSCTSDVSDEGDLSVSDGDADGDVEEC